MSKSILLIRHAESANNALAECERVPDPGLTERGKTQAERLAEALATLPITQLFCSPFKRSLDTTQPASLRLGLRPMIRADIYEQGGCYSGYEPGPLRGEPGMNRFEIAAAYPGWEIDEAIGPHGWNAGKEYETCEEVELRAKMVALWLANSWTPTTQDSMAALVIHADFKRVLLQALLESDQWPGCDQPIYNTGISRLRWNGNVWQLSEWNSAEHLPPPLRTPIRSDLSAA